MFAATTLAVLGLVALPAEEPFDISRAIEDQRYPTVEFGRDCYLVAWQDARDLAIDTSCNIYGCRVARSGAVLDTAGILIWRSRRDDYFPRTAWGGSDWVVIWQEGC